MTDEEMVKAMEICKDKEIPCDDCPLVECGDCEGISRQYFYDRFKQLQSENAELKSSLTHANEECLKWHERAQNLLKDSGGSISGYEKKISDLQAENAALRSRLEKAVELKVKVGDTVYFIPTYNRNPIWGVQKGIVQMVGITRHGYHVKIRDRADFNKTYMFGKSAFLSKEAAEARLAELKGGEKNG